VTQIVLDSLMITGFVAAIMLLIEYRLLLVMACVIGLIPESGPHLIFVTLYAEHAAPFGVLLASSIVQDGHGKLPMLAHSRRAFLAVKGVNFLLGLAAGAVAMGLETLMRRSYVTTDACVPTTR
jgi:hypothetical protein